MTRKFWLARIASLSGWERPLAKWPGKGVKPLQCAFVLDPTSALCRPCTIPRQVRIQYPGAMYHVMSRGDRREDIFPDDVDRQDFLKTLAEGCQKTDWQVHAYCLMRNHYHLVVETPNANLVAGMAWLQSSYTIRLNHRHPRDAGAGRRPIGRTPFRCVAPGDC